MSAVRSGAAVSGVSRAALLTAEEQRTLAEGVRNHDSAAEEDFVRLFSNRVACLALARTGNREAARDLTQDVMLAAVLALRNGHLRDGERLAGFVYGTARNLINNYLRTRSRMPQEQPIEGACALSPLPDPLEEADRDAVVRRALTDLDAIDRKILLLTLVEGLKPGEIAVQLGLTSDVVRARKSRALKKTVERVKELSRT